MFIMNILKSEWFVHSRTQVKDDEEVSKAKTGLQVWFIFDLSPEDTGTWTRIIFYVCLLSFIHSFTHSLIVVHLSSRPSHQQRLIIFNISIVINLLWTYKNTVNLVYSTLNANGTYCSSKRVQRDIFPRFIILENNVVSVKRVIILNGKSMGLC